MNNYGLEVKERFGGTDAYKEYSEKTADYTEVKWQDVNEGLLNVLARFADCKNRGCPTKSDEAQALVKELQMYITENYYTCDNKILAGLGQMYIADERFKNSIDKNGEGTPEFISSAIEIYCKIEG